MIKITTKYRSITSMVVLTVALNSTMAAEFVVQTNLDSGGGTTIAEISPDVYSIDTLRSAVEQANDEVSFPGADIIRFDENIIIFDPGFVHTTITLSQTGDQFDFQSQTSDSAMGIDSVITIQGTLPGAPELPIRLDADGLRHFQVNSGGKLRLFDLFLSSGETPLNSAGRGGAVVVLDNGKLEINNSLFSFNDAVNGGALAFQQGAQDGLIENSNFLFNLASDENPSTDLLGLGGAIFADLGTNSIIIENTYFKFNDADANGGALYINRPFEVRNSAFERNDAALNGGALYAGEQALFTISNSSLYINVSELRGGAVYNAANTVDAGRIFNSTLTINGAGWGLITSRQSRGLLTAGGAIYSSIADNLLIHNSIVAGNEDASVNDDIAATLSQASSYNLIGVAGEVIGVTHNTNGNLIGTAQQPLDPGLKFDTSFTVFGLEPSSPAVNSGSNAQVNLAGLTEDILGNDRVIGSAVDRGAFETDVFFYSGFE